MSSSNDTSKETQEYLRTVGLDVVVLLDHARSFEGTDDKSLGFSGAEFSRTIHDVITAVDKEVTRFIIACKPPALDAEIRALWPKINTGLFMLVQHFDRIPKTAGRTYLIEVRRALCKSLLAMVLLLNSYLGCKIELSNAILSDIPYTSAAGVVWDRCKGLMQIPVDNRAAVLCSWRNGVSDMIKDAADELHESISKPKSSQSKSGEEDEGSDSMDEFNPEISVDRLDDARSAHKLIMSAKIICEKIGLRCIRDCETLDEEHTIWLDRLLELGEPVQSAIDDLVAALYEDGEQWRHDVKLCSAKLTSALDDLVTLAITFVDDYHLPWFQLCRKRLDITKHTYDVVR
ncbi:hypothetical protein H4R26_004009 [Coemansia thaxteri]|uniref:Cyclin-D1-binding protein 1-like N-terminal domain-containing protein n=1 Tax=Coemansia thaxteri TaxID=2663907 RepID=A0A9W8EE22_9FUNG|nr:hypothetical protein H4R26_004009 [Coemansia thaxteri]KAJ2483141.1 hypothetical protein EV174_003026 [Coemansia sp. RSA 2320]